MTFARQTVGMAETHMDLDAFVELERGVWDALCRGDADADTRLLSDDFLGVYPSGFATRTEHAGQLANGPTVASYDLHEARLLVVSPDDVMLCYRADWHRIGSTDSSAESMYISSLWSRRDGRWLNLFSQDSPADG